MHTPLERLTELVYRCASASVFDKAVLSKCHDKTVQRCTLTLRRIRGELVAGKHITNLCGHKTRRTIGTAVS